MGDETRRRDCPRCGRPAEGNFCSSCGSSLAAVRCASCGVEAEAGGRFCNRCGAALPGAVGPGAPPPMAGPGVVGDSRAAWWVVGGLMVALILAVAMPIVRSDGGGAGGGMAGGAAGGSAPPATRPAPDISDMTPRQAADALYTRIMTHQTAGDSAEVAFFLPMGIAAYDQARPLDADGLFHLSLLERMARDATAALATAEEGLAAHPNHLLILSAAGGAAADLERDEEARGYYDRLLAAWDDQMAAGLPEYELHFEMMPEIRREAEAFSPR